MRSQELNCQTGHEDKSDNNNNSLGAELDFLSRERELLGDNAAEFATPNDTMASATVDDGIDDFFIGGGNQQSSSSGKEFFAFESSFPSIDAVRKSPRCALTLWHYILPDSLIMKTQEPPGSTITIPPPTTSQTAPSPSYHGKPDEEETEPIRCVIRSPLLPISNSSSPSLLKLFHNSLSTISFPSITDLYDRQWRIRRDQEIEQRTKLSASKKETTIASAKKWTDDFYEGYNRKKDQSIARARKEAEAYVASREDTTAGGTSWERVAKLVDLSGKGTRGGAAGTGKEKFRELLLGLKADKQAPGAGGYSGALVD